MRAAEALQHAGLLDWTEYGLEEARQEVAHEIDRESGLGEAANMLRMLLTGTCLCNCATCGARYEAARDVLTRLEGREVKNG